MAGGTKTNQRRQNEADYDDTYISYIVSVPA